MRKSFRSRGFTLLELLVGAAVGAVVMAGISLTFISQARQYQAHASRRGVQANARQALAFMGRHLRSAGYGVNPDRAIISWDSYDAAGDQQAPGYPDAFAVHFRDGMFRRNAAAVASNLITLPNTEPLNEDMRRGQILLVICVRDPGFIDPDVDENPPHRFVTVGQFVPAGATTIPLDQNPVLPLEDRPTQRPGRLFHEETVPGFAHPCFSRAPPQVMKVKRAAFYVAMFTNPNNNERKPYLMMHQGLDMPAPGNLQGDGVINASDAVPVAEGIEQLQVAYALNVLNTTPPTPPINNNVPVILGVTGPMGLNHFGEAWEQIDPVNLPPGWFFQPIPDGVAETANDPRVLDHPANIRQVRMTLVSRSSLPDPQIVGDDFLRKPDGTFYPDGAALPGGTIPWRHLENLDMPPFQDFTPAGQNFYRILLRESITPKNLLLNRQFAPSTPGGG